LTACNGFIAGVVSSLEIGREGDDPASGQADLARNAIEANGSAVGLNAQRTLTADVEDDYGPSALAAAAC